MNATVLIVDDQPAITHALARALKVVGFHTATAGTAAETRKKLAELRPDLMLLDLWLPDADGTELLEEARKTHPDTDIIVITGHASIPSSVRAIKGGAVDYLSKPFETGEVISAVRRALRAQALRHQVERLRSDSVLPYEVAVAEYPSRKTRELMQRARRVADQDTIVVIRGDSGTGKDHLARWIHRKSRRRSGPYFAINCGAVSASLADVELFGHEPGVGGTPRRKRGLLELADQGTLLLNEVTELEPRAQTRLLTFLDTQAFVRIGGEQTVQVDTRIVATTQHDLASAADRGALRKDLFYRLDVVSLEIPPLRERFDDLPMLVDEFLDELSIELGRPRPRVSLEALRAMRAYDWPGNVRELRNVLERALIMSDTAEVGPRDLNLGRDAADWTLSVGFPEGNESLRDVVRRVRRETIEEALRRTQTKQEAADLLGITRHALAHYLKADNIQS